MCFMQSPVKKCTVHSSLLKEPLLAWNIWTCCNCGISHSCKAYRHSYSSKTEVPPTSTMRFVSTVANHTDIHIPARRKSHLLPLWGSSVPEHSVTRMLDRACVWKWPTTDALAPEVPWHYALCFFLWGCIKDRVFIPALPHDLTDLKAWIIAAVKNIDAPMLTRLWQELEYCIDVCHVTHRTFLFVKKTFFSFPVAVNNSIKVWFSCYKCL